MKRTRAIGLLEEKRVPHQVKEFAAAEFTAEEAARLLDIPLSSVYKTLVAQSERSGPVLAVVPGDRELGLKKLAAALGEKRAEMLPLSDLTRVTGYVKGGVSPLGGKRKMKVFIDETARALPFISVSAGLRGVQIFIAPDNLLRAAEASYADLSDPQ